MMASSDVAWASIWPRPSATSVGTKRMPPPTPKSPERTPAASPRVSARAIVVTLGPDQPRADRGQQEGEPVRQRRGRDPLLESGAGKGADGRGDPDERRVPDVDVSAQRVDGDPRDRRDADRPERGRRR